MKGKYLGEFEEIVLLTIGILYKEALLDTRTTRESLWKDVSPSAIRIS